MKRTGLLFIFLALVVLELILLEVFIPYGWHHPISELLNRIFPPQEYKPHPNMDWEIAMMLQQHHLLRIGLYSIAGVLAAGNALLIYKVWKAFRSRKLPFVRT